MKINFSLIYLSCLLTVLLFCDDTTQKSQENVKAEVQPEEGERQDTLKEVAFETVNGSKADYSVSIPKHYLRKTNVGANVDLKYADSLGASIITVVKNIPGLDEADIHQLNLSDEQIVSHFESEGAQNVSVIKKGFKTVNGTESYYMIYDDDRLYHYSLNLIRNGKMLTLTYSCDKNAKGIYGPYIYRVMNSLKFM